MGSLMSIKRFCPFTFIVDFSEIYSGSHVGTWSLTLSFMDLTNPTCSVKETVSMATQRVWEGIHGIHSASLSFNLICYSDWKSHQLVTRKRLAFAPDIQS